MIPFAKYHGAGNDFVLIDLEKDLEVDLEPFARRVCDRRKGIGADGLLLLTPSKVADSRMRIFNADGSEPAMCGNGIRCVIDFILKKKRVPSEVAIETACGVLKGRREGDKIAVSIGIPTVLHFPIDLPEGTFYVLDTGVPHAVVFVNDLSLAPVEELGRQIRHHPHFAPHGVNVNFAQVTPEGKLAVRTYERGVEGETLACGTGAAATAFAAMQSQGLSSPIHVLTRASFDNNAFEHHLSFHFPPNASGSYDIEMIGSAELVFEGVLSDIKKN